MVLKSIFGVEFAQANPTPFFWRTFCRSAVPDFGAVVAKARLAPIFGATFA